MSSFTANVNALELMKSQNRPFMYLRILVENPDLRGLYESCVQAHNHKIMQNLDYPDAGFDLINPVRQTAVSGRVNKVELKVKCAATLLNGGESSSSSSSSSSSVNTGYYLYPRSSISKSGIRLANSVGIIDAGYRGQLIAMVDVVYCSEYVLDAYDKMFQICAPALIPIIAEVVDELGEKTQRGEGGFGSTGY
jgi:dUTP pyrophosphatase